GLLGFLYVQGANWKSAVTGIHGNALVDPIPIYRNQRLRVPRQRVHDSSCAHAIFRDGDSDCDVWVVAETEISRTTSQNSHTMRGGSAGCSRNCCRRSHRTCTVFCHSALSESVAAE